MCVGVNPISLPGTIIISGTHIPITLIRSLKATSLGVSEVNLPGLFIGVLSEGDVSMLSRVVPGRRIALEDVKDLGDKQAAALNPEALDRTGNRAVGELIGLNPAGLLLLTVLAVPRVVVTLLDPTGLGGLRCGRLRGRRRGGLGEGGLGGLGLDRLGGVGLLVGGFGLAARGHDPVLGCHVIGRAVVGGCLTIGLGALDAVALGLALDRQ